MGLSVVGGGPYKAEVQDARQGGFGVAGIGTGVAVSVAKEEAQGAGRAADYYHQQGGEAGGDKVGHIVETGGGAPKEAVAIAFVAQHRIEGVHHFVAPHEGESTHQVVKQRGNNAITQIFGQGFQGGCSDLVFVEATCVSTHNHGELAATGGESPID